MSRLCLVFYVFPRAEMPNRPMPSSSETTAPARAPTLYRRFLPRCSIHFHPATATRGSPAPRGSARLRICRWQQKPPVSLRFSHPIHPLHRIPPGGAVAAVEQKKRWGRSGRRLRRHGSFYLQSRSTTGREAETPRNPKPDESRAHNGSGGGGSSDRTGWWRGEQDC